MEPVAVPAEITAFGSAEEKIEQAVILNDVTQQSDWQEFINSMKQNPIASQYTQAISVPSI
jgi:hypothetical protein